MNKIVIIMLTALAVAACERQAASPPEEPVTDAGAAAESTVKLETDEATAPVELPSVRADSDAIQAAIDHEERPETDRDRDEQRQPATILTLAGARPGIKAFDLFTGGGYYGELLSRVVGPDGEVWVHNPPQFYERFGSADIDDRLAAHRLSNVTRHDRPVDDLALPSGRFDMVVAAMVFHDLFWLTDDVPGVLAQLYDAMAPGGVFLITDHAAPEGTGASFADGFESQHRIEEAHVVDLMQDAGFELVDESDALRVSDDPRTEAFFAPEMRGRFTDRFALLFRKPV